MSNFAKYFIITTFVSLYVLVSIISTIHVVEFFKLSNESWLAITLAIAFEIGAAASLASLIALDKMNRTIVWLLFFVLTAMQAMGNTYYAFVNLKDFNGWVELFGLVNEEIIYQKRILSLVSGAILPLIALGFIKSLVDYIKPETTPIISEDNNAVNNETNATSSKLSHEEYDDIFNDMIPYIDNQEIIKQTSNAPQIMVKESLVVTEDIIEQPTQIVEQFIEESIELVEEVTEESAEIVEQLIEESIEMVEKITEESAGIVEEPAEVVIEESTEIIEEVTEESTEIIQEDAQVIIEESMEMVEEVTEESAEIIEESTQVVEEATEEDVQNIESDEYVDQTNNKYIVPENELRTIREPVYIKPLVKNTTPQNENLDIDDSIDRKNDVLNMIKVFKNEA